MATTLLNRKNRLFDGDVIDLTSENKPEVGNTKINVNVELDKMSRKKQIAPTNKSSPKVNIQPPASEPIDQTVLLPILDTTSHTPTNQYLIPINSSNGRKFLLVDQTVLTNNNPPTPQSAQLISKNQNQIKLADKDGLTQLNFKNIGGKIVVEKSSVVQKKSPNVIIKENVTLSPNKQHKEENVNKLRSLAAQENILSVLSLPSSSETSELKETPEKVHNDLMIVNNQRKRKETAISTSLNTSNSSLDSAKGQISSLNNKKSINNNKQTVKSNPFHVAINALRDQRRRKVPSYLDITVGAEIELNPVEASTGVIELSDDEGDNLINKKETGTKKLILFSAFNNEKKQIQNKQSIAISPVSEKNVSLPSEKILHTVTPRKEKPVSKISNELFANSLRNRWIDVQKALSKNKTSVDLFKEVTEKDPVYYAAHALLDHGDQSKEIDNNYSITPEEVNCDDSVTQEEIVNSNETQQEAESNQVQYIDSSHGSDPLESPLLDPLGVVTPVDITRILNGSKKIDGRCGCLVLKKGTKGFSRDEAKKPPCLKYIREAISRDERKIKEFKRTLRRRVHFVQCDSDPSKFLPEDGSNDLTAVFNNIEQHLQTESSIPSITEVKKVISQVKNDITGIMGRSGANMGSPEKLAKTEMALKLIHTGCQLIRSWNKETQLDKKEGTQTLPTTITNVVKEVKKRGRKKKVPETTTDNRRTRNLTNKDDIVHESRPITRTLELKVPHKTYRNKRKAEEYSDDLLIVKKVNILKKKRD